MRKIINNDDGTRSDNANLSEMIKMSEQKKKDFIIDLMNEEYNRRIDIISKTGKLDPNDIITIATLTLNYEMGELVQEMAEIRTEMVTRKTLTYGLGILVTILTIVSLIIKIFIP